MKIIATLITALLLMTTLESEGQYVAIPDTAFGRLLSTNYPSCMTGSSAAGWSMDTTCSAIVNATSFSCAFHQISDLTGIRYFDNLQTFYCNDNHLQSLPSLPKTIKTLFCYNNQLIALPALPDSLHDLSCYNNPLHRLPALSATFRTISCYNDLLDSLPALPATMTYLQCDNNSLTTLPTLPSSLIELYCENNLLTSLPALPNSLTKLWCQSNFLTSLPALSTSLSDLYCDYNQITSLPALPNSLFQFSCRNNQITNMPAVPVSLYSLTCSYNQITNIPALPNNLSYLFCDHNQLSSLPSFPHHRMFTVDCSYNFISSITSLPDTLQIFDCRANQSLSCLPPLGIIHFFYFDSTAITCLPRFPQNFADCEPHLSTISLCAAGNPNGCQITICSGPSYASVTDSMCIGNPYDFHGYNHAVAGTYIDTISTVNGCDSIVTLSLYNKGVAPGVVTDTLINADCNPYSGQICIHGVGGVSPYTYYTSIGTVSPCMNNLSVGVYHIIVTDAEGCYSTISDTIRQAPPLVIITDTLRNVNCNPHTGEVCVHADGGISPYSYDWNVGLTTSCIQVATAGIFSVSVSDASGCTATISDTIAQDPAPNFTFTVSGVTCYGDSNGSISVNPGGSGSGAYVYVWGVGGSGGAGLTGNLLNGLRAATYCVSMTDTTSGCTLDSCLLVTEPLPLTVTDSVHPVSCGGGRDGSICLTVTGGTPTYVYTWGPPSFSNQNCADSLLAGGYSVTISDVYGCTANHIGVVTQPLPLAASVTVTNVTCYADSNGSITIAVSGGVPPYDSINWFWGNVGPFVGSLTPGTYTYNIRDAVGCRLTDSATVGGPPQIIIIDSVHNVSCAGGDDGSVIVIVSGGAPPFSYNWSIPVPHIPEASLLTVGAYSVVVTDAYGCTMVLGDSVRAGNDCIWPGDADADMIVDNNDLLPIGLGYDSIGPSRQSVSIVWQADFANDWSNIFASSVNFKHADCNGDGIIDANDTLAISQNFGLTHTKTNGSPKPWRSGLPVIYPVLNSDTVTKGDTLLIDINLGEVSLNATNIYGIAFNLNYDAAVVDTTQTSMTFGNSWLGTPADAISIYKDLKSQGVIKAAITRIDHTTRSGQGPIAHLRAIVTTDNIDGKDLQYYKFVCSISDVKAIDAQGHVIDLNEGVDSNQVAFTPLGIPDINMLSSSVSVYPNPTNNVVTITCTKANIDGADVMDVLGERVRSYSFANGKGAHTLDLQGLSSGIYYISIKTKLGTITKKVLVAY